MMAICKAAQTKLAGIAGLIAQPTILRECKSSTAARYSQPLRVRMLVISATQAWLGSACSNCRFSTLAETARPCLLSVV